MVDPVAFEAHIDKRMASMEQRPALYGSLSAIEATCLTFMELFSKFCLNIDNKTEHDSYMAFRRTHFGKNLGPLNTAGWLKGDEHGWMMTEHEMGQKLVGLMIAWKAHLKAEHGKS